MALNTLCDFAKARYVDAGRNRRRWEGLVYVLGVIATILLVLSILLLLHSNWSLGVASSLGTILGGTATKWIVDQRNAAVDEDKQAFADLERACGRAFLSPSFAGPGKGGAGPVAFFKPLADLTPELNMETKIAPWYQELEIARGSDKAAKGYIAALRGKN